MKTPRRRCAMVYAVAFARRDPAAAVRLLEDGEDELQDAPAFMAGAYQSSLQTYVSN